MNQSVTPQLLNKFNRELSENMLQFFQKLNQLNWQQIYQKLVAENEVFQWQEEDVNSAISLYKMFLCLNFLFPDTELVPTPEIDRVWHTHILINTAKYIQDCQTLYGYILHHYSPVTENLEISQQVAFSVTKDLFWQIFGVDICQNRVSYGQGCLILPQDSPQLQRHACLTIPKNH